jgi:hypothetical protein
MSIPKRRRPVSGNQFFNPPQTTTESGLQRLRREQAEREKSKQQAEEARRSQHAQNATPTGR